MYRSFVNPLISEATRITDCTQVCKIFSMRLYADDSSLTVSGKNKDALLYQINLEIPYIYDWFALIS